MFYFYWFCVVVRPVFLMRFRQIKLEDQADQLAHKKPKVMFLPRFILLLI